MKDITPRYCLVCAGSLNFDFKDGAQRHHCPQCSWVHYENPGSAALGVLLKDQKVLLVKRGMPPAQGSWAFPGGFQEKHESSEEAVCRELWEETGLKIRVSSLRELIYINDEGWVPLNLMVYNVEWVSGELQAGDDVSHAQFFSLDQLPEPIAFSNHRRILEELRGLG